MHSPATSDAIGPDSLPERAAPDDLHRAIVKTGRLTRRLMAQTAEALITQGVDVTLQVATPTTSGRVAPRSSACHQRGLRQTRTLPPPPGRLAALFLREPRSILAATSGLSSTSARLAPIRTSVK